MSQENISLKFLFHPDGSLNKQSLSWITEPQKNALIMELYSNLQKEEVKNSILQGKINTYETSTKSYLRVTELLTKKLGKAELIIMNASKTNDQENIRKIRAEMEMLDKKDV